MINECVGFVGRYLRHKNTNGKSINSFIVDDIFLSIAEDDKEPTETATGESSADETEEKSEKKENQIFLIFPFKNSKDKLKLETDKVTVKEKPENPSDLVNLDIVKEYGYSDAEVDDLKNIFKEPGKHMGLVSDNNKRIGGSQSLSSSVIYAIEIASFTKKKDKNKQLETKFTKGFLESQSFKGLFELTKTKSNKKKEEVNVINERFKKFVYDVLEDTKNKKKAAKYPLFEELHLNNVGPELANYFKSPAFNNIAEIVESKARALPQATASIVIINLIPPRKGIANVYDEIRTKYYEQNVFNDYPEDSGVCGYCSEERLVGVPWNQIALDTKKLFLRHPTRMSNDDDKPVMLCHECAIKYAAFFGLLKKWKIKIIPLFVNTILQDKEIRLLDKDGVNSFVQIFNQIGSSNSLEFYLVLYSGGELKYFDYVCNYDWRLEWSRFNTYSGHEDDGLDVITRSAVDRKVCAALGIKYMNYFEEKKELTSLQSHLRNLLAEKVFNFVYRNVNRFTESDIWQLSVKPIENLALGSQKDFEEQINNQLGACLELWFNRNRLLSGDGGLSMSIKELRDKAEIGDSPEKWAYRAGRAYRFLVSKQAGQENLELENIVRLHKNQDVNSAIVKKLEQRAYALDEDELKQYKLQLAELLAFDAFKADEFKDLKPYFYAGYVDMINGK